MSWLQNQQLTMVCVGFILWTREERSQIRDLCHLHKERAGKRVGSGTGDPELWTQAAGEGTMPQCKDPGLCFHQEAQ